MRIPLASFLSIVTLLLFSTAGLAQVSSNGGRISFKEHSHDFGVFHEGKDAQWDFRFTNTGKDSIRITSVHAQCGCTTPSYDHHTVAPGDTGKISVVYHSEYRPGPFEKEVVITTDGDPATVKVRIKGNVLPKPLKGRDITLIGGIRFSDGLINLDTMARGEPKPYILHFQNASPYPIRILKLDHPVDVQAYYPPFTVLTGEMMRVTMTFIPSEKRPYGVIRDSLVFKTNDREKPVKVIYFEAFVSRKNRMKHGIGPVLLFEKDFIDLGTVNQRDTAQAEYRFRNDGSDSLHITSVETSCGCTVATLKKKWYGPGESGIIHVSFDAGGKFGEIRKEIMVKSNDPMSPRSQLILRSNVVVHPRNASGMMSKIGAGASIFKGKCRSCHVDKGLGKKGEALFAADCQLCHGPAGKKDSVFHPGPALDNAFLSTLMRKLLFKRIAEGSVDPHMRHMMPGFVKAFGGPLSEEQVQSLVNYLQTVKISN